MHGNLALFRKHSYFTPWVRPYRLYSIVNKAIVDVITSLPVLHSCESLRLSHAPHSPLRANTTSSSKPEVHNLLHCRQRTTEPRPPITRTQNYLKFVEFLLSVIELIFLSLAVEALQGKMCQNSLPSGGGGSV